MGEPWVCKFHQAHRYLVGVIVGEKSAFWRLSSEPGGFDSLGAYFLFFNVYINVFFSRRVTQETERLWKQEVISCHLYNKMIVFFLRFALLCVVVPSFIRYNIHNNNTGYSHSFYILSGFLDKSFSP